MAWLGYKINAIGVGSQELTLSPAKGCSELTDVVKEDYVPG
jgi:hypothetical protein